MVGWFWKVMTSWWPRCHWQLQRLGVPPCRIAVVSIQRTGQLTTVVLSKDVVRQSRRGNGEGAWNHDMLWCLVVRFLAAEVDVHFKTTWRPCPASRQGQRGGPVAYQKERASPLFTRRRGYALDGTDLFVSEMTIEGAKRFCAELQDCEGFTFKGSESVDGTTLIHFKSRSRLMLDSTGMSTCYVFETESRSHALPADGATFFQLITDGKEEVDLLEEVEVAKAATPEPSRIPSGPLVEGPRWFELGTWKIHLIG